MIIEAEPRRGVGRLEGYIISRGKPDTERCTISHNNPPTSLRNGKFRSRKSKSFRGTSSTAHRFVKKVGSSVARIKYSKTLYRDHPYEREEASQSKSNKSTSPQGIPEKISHRAGQRPAYLRACFKRIHSNEEAASSLKKISVHVQNANANENNDNCPNSVCLAGKTGISSPLSDALKICEVEIEDLAASSAVDCLEKIRGFRRRRRSFNTNPHSSFEGRVHTTGPHLHTFNHQHHNEYSRGYPDEAFLAEEKEDKLYIRQVLGIHPKAHQVNTWSIPQGWGLSSECQRTQTDSDNTKNLKSSIEKLVRYFEANSSPTDNLQTDEKGTSGESPSHAITSANTTGWKRLQRTSYSSHEGGKITQPLLRPFSCRSASSNNSKLVTFSEIVNSEGSNPEGIFTSQNKEYQDLSNTVSGRVYNNNGNAASAYRDSKLNWTPNYCAPGRCTKVCNQKSRPKTNFHTVSTSDLFLPTNRGGKVSAFSLLSRVADDVELIDLESTRLTSWPGTQSIPAAVERQPYQLLQRSKSIRYDTEELIDLETTSGHGQPYDSRFFNFPFPSNNPKYPGGPSVFRQRFQAAKENPKELTDDNSFQSPRRASANNHHNKPPVHDQRVISDFRQDENLCLNNTERRFPFGNFVCHHSLLRRKANFRQPDPSEMGCIQSIAKTKVSPDRCHHGIIVEDIAAAIDRVPTEIEEKSPIVLRYRTPYFRASAHVIVPPIPRKETWTVGWIQACDAMKFINQYGDLGNSSWEIPALKDRRVSAVSDSDGVSYPWYGNTTEIATIEGPTDTSRSLTLRMNDNFYPSVTWDIPVSEGSEAHLTHITRDQSFTTWLAAVNQTTGRLEVLRTVKWHFYLEIDVNPTLELGERACIVSPMVQKQPVVLKNNTEPIYISSPYRGAPNASVVNGGRQKRVNRRPGVGGDNNSNNHTNFIPKSALVRPSANNAQTLIWRPVGDLPVIVVPAKEEYKENNEIVWFTRTPTMHGHDHNVRVLSLQEMAKLKKSISR